MMVYQGTIQNGVVVFSDPVPLPDGTTVKVVSAMTDDAVTLPDIEDDPLYNIGELAVDMGISDLSSNIDHYLYGHPKVNDGQ
jgi:hypothetical protein